MQRFLFVCQKGADRRGTDADRARLQNGAENGTWQTLQNTNCFRPGEDTQDKDGLLGFARSPFGDSLRSWRIGVKGWERPPYIATATWPTPPNPMSRDNVGGGLGRPKTGTKKPPDVAPFSFGWTAFALFRQAVKNTRTSRAHVFTLTTGSFFSSLKCLGHSERL